MEQRLEQSMIPTLGQLLRVLVDISDISYVVQLQNSICTQYAHHNKTWRISQVFSQWLKDIADVYLKNMKQTMEVIRLAQKLGFIAIAITVNSQTFGKKKKNDERASFRPAFLSLELFKKLGYYFKMRDANNPDKSFVDQVKFDLSWKDIRQIKHNTHLKIILKGVLSPEDIPLAEQCKVDTIWVSNHGGRQLDTAPATILMFPIIRAKLNEINSKMELFIDGGVRKGEDIFKCLFSIIKGEEGVTINWMFQRLFIIQFDDSDQIINQYDK